MNRRATISVIVSILVLIAASGLALGEVMPMANASSITSHGGVLTGGSPTVFIGGDHAWRCSVDFCMCPLYTPPYIPHVGGYAIGGSSTVLIEGYPAAYQGCLIYENGSVNTITSGCPTVLCGR